ncbi:MAG TPA: NHLP leader peptide family RiPP precursor [bacterium]|nr:NHLP leader peptide family RiPP precursor [bacterium]HPN32148.1 NHLP leader peptide family RiPP precursor [bacterium]
MKISQDEMRKKYAKIVAKAWADEDYKKNLLNNTETVLKNEGFEVPADLKIQIIEEPENTKIFVLPQKTDDNKKIETVEKRIAAC